MKTAEIEVNFIDHCGSDLSVVNAARTSFDKETEWEYPIDIKELADSEDWEQDAVDMGFYINQFGGYQRLKPADQKLIKYLAKHKHFSPFNHSFISVRVKAPVFVARQLV